MNDYIILSSDTPNDQGFRTPNHVCDFKTRFAANPVMLANHGDDECGNLPIGRWEDVHIEGDNIVARPVFSDADHAKPYKNLYEEGNMKAASLGGICSLKKTGKKIRNAEGKLVDEIWRDENGIAEAQYFLVYEASFVAIPSNSNCLSVRLMSEQEIVKLNSIYMREKTTTTDNAADEQLPVEKQGAFGKFLTSLKSLISEHSEPDGDEPVIPLEPTKEIPNDASATGLEGENGKEVIEEVTEKKLAAQPTPVPAPTPSPVQTQLKSKMEVTKNGVSVVEPPATPKATVIDRKLSFSKLSSDVEGAKIVERVLNIEEGTKKEEFQTVLGAMMNEPRFKQVLHAKDANTGRNILNFDIKSNQGHFSMGLQDAMAKLAGASFDNPEYRKLGTSADALATPELQMIAWMGNVFYKLFPNNDWKKDIPIFAAQMTGTNIGLIWPNIAADPAVYVGALQTRSPYSVTDDAKSVSMLTYALQPMRWTPLTNHTQPHDVVSTQWNQALMKFEQVVSDKQLYTILALVPAASIRKSRGASQLIEGGTNELSFALNTAFTGNVKSAMLTDSLMFEQLFLRQNYPNTEKITFCTDDVMNLNISQDQDTRSLLTRFMESNQKDIIQYKNTSFVPRSYYGLYDTATGGIVDPTGVIPATAQSITPVFLPSQLAIALGKIDVFFVQDPTNYGIVQSMDTRIGITTMRTDNKGLAAYTYGDGVNPLV